MTYIVDGGECRNGYPGGLTVGGRVIYRRTGFAVSVCNLLASLAGLGNSAEG